MQELLLWRNNQEIVNCSTDQLQAALKDEHATIWLDIQTGDKLSTYNELLTTDFTLPKLVMDSIAEEKERAKIVEIHKAFYIVLHGIAFDPETEEAITPKIDIVFGHNYILTVHREPTHWLDELREHTSRDNSEDNIMSHGVPRLLHSIIDTMVDSYFPVLDLLDELLDDLEETTIRDSSRDTQERLFNMKRTITQIRRVISPQIEVSNSLITRTGDFVPADVEPYFADVHGHLVRIFEVIDSYRDLTSGLLDVYLSTVSNRLNQIMKQLTLISTIFLPITFITGIFGQNFGHSPQVDHDVGFNFWIVLGIMITITVFQLLYFRYRKWI